MHAVLLADEDDFEGWRDGARALVLAGVPPREVTWQVGQGGGDLFGDEAPPPVAEGPAFGVPRAFLTLAQSVICHSDPERFALLYTLLCRIRADAKAMEDSADPLVQRLERMAKEVRRDLHKMHAFVRFREVAEEDGATRFVAWFEPDHHIVRATAGFFVRRFAGMRWSILTPELSIHWDGQSLREGPGATRAEAPGDDPVEEVWKTYYSSIFNPARLKVGAMLKEMPKKYWKNMPETALVRQLVAGAQGRETAMVEASKRKLSETEVEGLTRADRAERRIEPGGNALAAWEAILADAKACTRCHLYKLGTQTVFGEGPLDAKIMFVGEQPGDQEDLAGRPFVGPAGQLFDRALGEAGVDRAQTYVTNAVKHFKFERRGKARLHRSPNPAEQRACRVWLEGEIARIRPDIVVCLGAIAARNVFGTKFGLMKQRGTWQSLPDGGRGFATVHPSWVLRQRDSASREAAMRGFVADLALLLDA